MQRNSNKIEKLFHELLKELGEDPDRGGLSETPARAAKAFMEYTKGYEQKPEDVLKVFTDGAEGYNEIVLVRDIPIYSLCEHHLAPIFGTVTIGYIPDGFVVGLSKFSRLADVYARRLQVQERMTHQIAKALQLHLKPKAVGVVVKARHLCMEQRGIHKQGHITVTSSMYGAFLNNPSARAEFLDLAR